ncbi:ACS family glucarate transporter-like MFS transporter [Maribacter vaceletii]|uniref:ACS family glucarate transporter-like MFS transporter n=1 Tax=Maribacter vaceletii TaxID=1206816 RepID=A0A495ECY5_9FLAO|nr:MFS transporter [Maribacter vaceletii]RKR14413.1 ACS family glucarate transporter-like MFS transporter [Maribacter vaceletii]
MKKNSFFPKRYFMIVGTFLLALLLYVDRICISVAKEPIAEALSLSDKQMGWVLAAFSLGYAFFQTPSGIMVDRFGPRKILTIIVVLWSSFTAITGAAWNFISLLIIRFLFGAGEAGAFPGMSRAIYSWIPLKERGIVTGINFSGSRLGAAFAVPAVAWAITDFGWRNTFVLLGVLGGVWAICWYIFFRDTPEELKSISQEEKDFIISQRQEKNTNATTKKIHFGTLLKSKNMWLAMGQYFCSNFTFFFALTWLFPHIKSEYQLDTVEAGLYTAIPLVFGAFGNWFSGWLIDKIYKKGKWDASRIFPASLGFALAAIGLLGSVYMSSAVGAIVFLSIAIFGADMTLPPSWAFCVDIGKKHAGTVSGTMNMAGNIGAFITALLFPYLLSWTGSTTLFFVVGAILNIIAVLIWFNMKPHKHFSEY